MGRNNTRTQGGIAAVGKVQAAVKRGVLEHPTAFACADCGGPASEYDHRNYHRPLEVVAVCRPCNAQRGAAIPANDCCISYSSTPSRGFVLSADGIRNLRFEAVDFGLYEEAGDSGVVSAGPGAVSHGNEASLFFSLSTSQNASEELS